VGPKIIKGMYLRPLMKWSLSVTFLNFLLGILLQLFVKPISFS